MTRAHRGRYSFRCRAFSSPAPCRFIPALSQTRKIIKTRGHFPTEDAARKLIYLAITKAETRWQRVFHWPAALAAFKIHFGDRIPDNAI
jgi:hypothetical protein